MHQTHPGGDWWIPFLKGPARCWWDLGMRTQDWWQPVHLAKALTGNKGIHKVIVDRILEVAWPSSVWLEPKHTAAVRHICSQSSKRYPQVSLWRALFHCNSLLQRASDASTNVTWAGNYALWRLNRVWEPFPEAVKRVEVRQKPAMSHGIASLSGGVCCSHSNGIVVSSRRRRHAWQPVRHHVWSKTRLKL